MIEQKFGAKKAEIEDHFHQLKERWLAKANGDKHEASNAVNAKIDQGKAALKKP